MKNKRMIYIAITFLIAGSTLIGWGIGSIFNNSCEGLIIGLGIGFIFSAFKILKVFRILQAYRTT